MNAENILTIGIDYRIVHGGVAAVENVYSTFYKPFNHVTTVVDGGQVNKFFILCSAFFQFFGWMLFRPQIEIVHVHGFTDHDLIMGVNDAGQIKNQAFAQDSDIIEEIVKPLQNEIIRMNFDNDAIRLIKSSDIICVYGMSIGGTDKKWWQLVMNWLQESTANHLIVLQHRAGTKFTFRWNRLVKEIRSKLFLYGDVPEEKRKALENRIHIDVNHDIFAMDLRKHPLKFEVKIDTSNFSPDVIRNILGPSENTEKPVSNV